MLNELRYTFGDYLAFSWQAWLAAIESWHRDWFPIQPVGFALGLLVIAMLAKRRPPEWCNRFTLIVTGLSWVAVGAVLHLRYLAALDWSATWTGAGFIVQGVLLGLVGLTGSRLGAQVASSSKWFALFTALFAVVGYPLAQLVTGVGIASVDGFATGSGGVTLMTAALVLLLPRKFCWLLIIPWLWALRQFTLSWPLGDFTGMTLLPWMTVALLWSMIGSRYTDTSSDSFR